MSISLPEADLTFLDQYSEENGLESRSAAVHTAIRALRDTQLEAEYTDAFTEWEGSEDKHLLETTVSDGLEPDLGWAE